VVVETAGDSAMVTGLDGPAGDGAGVDRREVVVHPAASPTIQTAAATGFQNIFSLELGGSLLRTR
jgi:hypothetical protein